MPCFHLCTQITTDLDNSAWPSASGWTGERTPGRTEEGVYSNDMTMEKVGHRSCQHTNPFPNTLQSLRNTYISTPCLNSKLTKRNII